MKVDPYLSKVASTARLLNEYERYGSLVVAYDFDNTVFDYFNEGHTYDMVIQLLRDLKSIGCYLICFTANEDTQRIADFLTANDIPFDKINENPPFFTCKAGKIYYNALLDDRAGLWQVYHELRYIVDILKTN
jgi:hypothetical protein